jgi:hypothetical protein
MLVSACLLIYEFVMLFSACVVIYETELAVRFLLLT